jgi:hypothetical protein
MLLQLAHLLLELLVLHCHVGDLCAEVTISGGELLKCRAIGCGGGCEILRGGGEAGFVGVR